MSQTTQNRRGQLAPLAHFLPTASPQEVAVNKVPQLAPIMVPDVTPVAVPVQSTQGDITSVTANTAAPVGMPSTVAEPDVLPGGAPQTPTIKAKRVLSKKKSKARTVLSAVADEAAMPRQGGMAKKHKASSRQDGKGRGAGSPRGSGAQSHQRYATPEDVMHEVHHLRGSQAHQRSSTSPNVRSLERTSVKTNIELPVYVHEKLREASFYQRRSIRSLMLDALNRLVDDNGRKLVPILKKDLGD